MTHRNAAYRINSPLKGLAAMAWAVVSTFALTFVLLTYFKDSPDAALLGGAILANGCVGLWGLTAGGGFFAGIAEGYRTGRSTTRSEWIVASDDRHWERDDSEEGRCHSDNHRETPLINPSTGLEMSGGVDSAGYLQGES